MATKRPIKNDPLSHLDEDGPRLVYAIDGEERILVDEAIAAIRDRVLQPRARDFNLDLFTAREAKLERVIDAAQTLPAFAPVRVVIVKGAEKWLGGSEDDEPSADSAPDLAPLVRYLENPSPTTVLMFVGTLKLDARTKVYKLIQKLGGNLRFSHPSEREMGAVVAARADKLGADIEPRAVDALVNALGADVGGAIAALEKLALFAGPGRAITREDVETLVSPVREEAVWHLSDAVAARDVAKALSLVHQMMNVSRIHGLPLLGMLAKQWRQLATVRSLIDAKASRESIEAALPGKVPPFVVDKLMTQARRHQLPGLIQGLAAIAQADQRLKGGKLEGVRVMERLVLTLIPGA